MIQGIEEAVFNQAAKKTYPVNLALFGIEVARAVRREEASRNRHTYRIYKLLHRPAAMVREKDRYWGKDRAKQLVHRPCEICGKDLAGTKSFKWCAGVCCDIGTQLYTKGYYGRKGKDYSRGQDWRRQKLLALQRDGWEARCCGKRKGLVVHHIVEYAFTQDNSLGNLVTLCRGHHTGGHRSKVFLWSDA